MPPTNIDAASAQDLGTLPVTIVEDVQDAAGPLHEVWFKYTAVAGEIVIGVWAFGGLATNYLPSTTIWTGPDPSTLSLCLDNGVDCFVVFNGTQNIPLTVPVVVGQTYYFQIRNIQVGDPEPLGVSLTFSVQTSPQVAAPAGSIFITDDQPGYHGALVGVAGSATPGMTLQYVNVPGGSDFDAGLPSGIFLIDAPFAVGGETLLVYSPQFALIASTLSPFSIRAISSNQQQTFYVGTPGQAPSTNASVTTISDAGVLGPTTWSLGGIGLVALAPSPDESLLYYAGTGSSINAAIRRWDLVNDVGLTDLLPGVVDYRTGQDILVFADGSLIVYYVLGSTDSYIEHRSSAGALLHTYAFTVERVNRLGQDLTDATFWAWTFLKADIGMSRFQQIRVSDGVILQSYDVPQYEVGSYSPILTSTPVRFGTSNSCPIMVLRQGITPPPPPPPPPPTVCPGVDVLPQTPVLHVCPGT